MNIFNNFEEFSQQQDTPANIKIQYLVLFRQWKKLFEQDISKDIDNPLYYPVLKEEKIEWEKHNTLTLKNCIDWNWGYIEKYLRKNNNALYEELRKSINGDNELCYYSDIIEGGKDVYELFYCSMQPILDVDYIKAQEKASENLKELKFNLIFDEVGTGKTVSALYCMRDVLTAKKERSKILIVCPNNKKNEWKSDIQRQLGRYAHYVENNDDENIYNSNLKELFFKSNEPCIFIEGQKENEMKPTLHNCTNKIKWDLVVIDEGHLCFDNYKNLKGEKTILLTATPIVVNSSTIDGGLDISKVRKLQDYVVLLKEITNSKEELQLDNLFVNNNLFTQLFREDLDLESKGRNITFLECDRFEDREIYLDLLGDVKGGMTRLVYEQDDDFLLHGVYERFRADIENAGYLINDKKTEISNSKFDALKGFINKNPNKSYIIFCNYKYPADNIYIKFVDRKNELENMENTIIAKKYGGDNFAVYPTDNTVTKDNIFDYLIGNIQQGKRVIFITTGASGGTGLNLGNFDGVINYELPFTCIELEQRFGRVDRMNSNAESKDMIFILNKDSNPMLRYSALKINATCTYMPIRNTVLFYPAFINANIDSLKKELDSCKISDEENETIYNITVERNKYPNKENEMKAIEEYLLKKRSLDNYDKDVDDISDYAELLNKNIGTVLSVYYKKKKLLVLKDELDNWNKLLDSDGSKEESQVVSYQTAEEDTEREEYTENGSSIQGNGVVVKYQDKGNKLSFFYEISFTAEDLKKELPNNITEQKGTTGIFYIKESQYIRQTVEEFRGEKV